MARETKPIGRSLGRGYPPAIRQEAIRLLGRGLSLKQVSQRTGVSRSVLCRVRKGESWRRRNFGSKAAIFSGQSKGRCPTCGAVVYLPCLACKLRGET
jgi:hypothetical protein